MRVRADVDMIPEDDRNLYHCSEQPRHLSVAVEKFHWGLPYGDYFGGVTLFSRRLVALINGASNLYWGWGGEGALRLDSTRPDPRPTDPNLFTPLTPPTRTRTFPIRRCHFTSLRFTSDCSIYICIFTHKIARGHMLYEYVKSLRFHGN